MFKFGNSILGRHKSANNQAFSAENDLKLYFFKTATNQNRLNIMHIFSYVFCALDLACLELIIFTVYFTLAFS